MTLHVNRFSALVGVLVVGVLLGGSVTALATARARTTTISACVAGSNGAPYGVKTKGKPKCRGRDKTVSWSQSGPAGPPGAPGTAATAVGTSTTVRGTGPLHTHQEDYDLLIPGLSQTMTVATATTVLVSTDGSAFTSSAVAGAYGGYSVALDVDGVVQPTPYVTQFCLSPGGSVSGECPWSFSTSVRLTPGTHVLKIVAGSPGAGSGMSVGGASDSLTPDEMTVTLLNG